MKWVKAIRMCKADGKVIRPEQGAVEVSGGAAVGLIASGKAAYCEAPLPKKKAVKKSAKKQAGA
ncbi:hypothetical protein N9937_01735 [bacterium]|nr:hypothetical protein [bacterium]